ncbi:MAG: spore cortex-lytic enzyme [Clostridiales bacterium]|nr:spore cortex-lytic enzyme [Clostridiales bacterium]
MFLMFNALEISAQAAALRRGSSGSAVREVQTRLRNWGYYSYAVDGIFGSRTETAVKWFQRQHGLAADGVVGKQTANALGISLPASSGGGSSSSTTSNEVNLLARVVYGEARGEPYKGQVAVAAVVLNRIKSSKFPNTMAGVVYQQGAFSIVADGQINLAPNETAIKAAKDALNGWDPTNGCLYYYEPTKTTNKWMLSKPIILRIGNHVFIKE